MDLSKTLSHLQAITEQLERVKALTTDVYGTPPAYHYIKPPVSRARASADRAGQYKTMLFITGVL